MSTESAPAPAPETTAAPKRVKKLDFIYYENDHGDRAQLPIGEVYKAIADQFPADTVFPKGTPEDAAKRLLNLNLASYPKEAEVPGEYEDLSIETANTFAFDIASVHTKYLQEITEEKNSEKKKKEQQKQADKEAKEAEDKVYNANGDNFMAKFKNLIEKKASKINDFGASIGNKLKLPDGFAVSGNCMGLTIAEGITPDDFATGAATIVGQIGALQGAETAYQFMLGDLINQAVSAKVFRNKQDAAGAMITTLKERLQGRIELGAAQQYATMAERITPDRRVMGIRPTHYFNIARLALPRMKDLKPEKVKELEEKIVEKRNEMVDRLNKGELVGTDIAAELEKFRQENGFGKKVTTNPQTQILRLSQIKFWCEVMIENLARNGTVQVMPKGKEKKPVSYTVEQLESYRDDAHARLQAILLADYDMDALMQGNHTVKKKNKEVIEPYFLIDPLAERIKEEFDAGDKHEGLAQPAEEPAPAAGDEPPAEVGNVSVVGEEDEAPPFPSDESDEDDSPLPSDD